MLEGGQIRLPDAILREQLLDDLSHMDIIDRQMVVPYLSTATKPAGQKN
jgi:hypothetical protein